MHSDVIIGLITEINERTEERKEAFAALESVGQKEFFAAAQVGFKAEYKISLWLSDYSGQNIVELERFGRMERFAVYRKYQRDDEKIELYLTDKVGVFYGG